jgi:DNA-directed RNA polymerase specialized sigma24 family protein
MWEGEGMKEDDGELHAFIEGRRDRLFRSAFLLCGDRHEADDLVQSTLLSVFIASRRRMWRRETPHADLPEPAGFSSGAADPDSQQTRAVLAALAGLPVKQRAVLVLRYWEDLTVDATAAALNMRPGVPEPARPSRGSAPVRRRSPTDRSWS